VSITQSIKGFFREMDTYGRINQKTILESIIVLADYINELAKVNIHSEAEYNEKISNLESQLDVMNLQLNDIEAKIKSIQAVKHPGRQPGTK
jgi:hypothetical protein